jgi:hypothetical protein
MGRGREGRGREKEGGERREEEREGRRREGGQVSALSLCTLTPPTADPDLPLFVVQALVPVPFTCGLHTSQPSLWETLEKS